MNEIFETHAHYDDEAFDMDMDQLLNDMHQKGIEYLTTMHLLSNCNALFGSLVGSTMGAICMNCGAYEGVEIFDAGMYQ